MEQARKIRVEAEMEAPRPAPPRDSAVNGLDKVLRFSLPGRDGEGDAARDRAGGLTARDISHAIDLVHDAAQSIKAAEERVRDGEARTQALVQRATEELKAAEGRTQAAEARARAAEARLADTESRLKESEARVSEAEGWLRQIFSTISEELPTRR